MRHQCKGRKLGSSWSHTKAMKRSLVRQLFLNDRIKTTETRAKEIRGNVDRVITWAKKGDLHARRLAIAALGNDKELVREIFEKVQQGMFEGRPGGYTRIMKLGPRKGDGAPVVIMELVTEPCTPKGEKKTAAKATKATPKKAAPKKVEKNDEEGSESIIEEVKESIEAAEENFAAEVQEEGEKQLAEEKAEAAADEAKVEEKEAEKAEEVREEQFEAEEARAEDAKAEELKAEAEEKAK